MNSLFRTQALITMSLAVATLALEVSAQSTGFRVETDVYQKGVSNPVQQTVTLFSGGIAYDISRDDSDDEITMVDPELDRIVLLNRKHKVQTEVKISDLAKLFEAAKAQALTNDLAPFVANAQQVENLRDKVVVGDVKLMRYEATLQSPEDDAIAEDCSTLYRQFADAAKYLNAYHQRTQPPFARLTLNAQIAAQKSIPKEIKLQMQKQDALVELTCRLIPAWELSDSDKKRVLQIGQDKLTFTAVSSAEYQRITAENVATK